MSELQFERKYELSINHCDYVRYYIILYYCLQSDNLDIYKKKLLQITI